MPPTIRWETEVSEFLDRLVDVDIRYLDVQMAIERLILQGLWEEVAVPFQFAGRTLHYHRVPRIFPTASFELYVLTTIELSGEITVLHIGLQPGN